MTKGKEEFDKHSVIMKILSSVTELKKDKENPFYNSKYVDLPTVLKMIKPVLSKNDCYLVQRIVVSEKTILKTEIFHKNGTLLLNTECPIPVKDCNNPQNWGSALTFMKRYSLSVLLALEEEDDDGNKATKTSKNDSIMMEVLNLFLSEKIRNCASGSGLEACWKGNKRYIDKLKEESEKDFKKLVDLAKKLKEELDSTVTNEEKKDIAENE